MIASLIKLIASLISTDKDGMEAYAVASVWLAALFVRTDRCIARG